MMDFIMALKKMDEEINNIKHKLNESTEMNKVLQG